MRTLEQIDAELKKLNRKGNAELIINRAYAGACEFLEYRTINGHTPPFNLIKSAKEYPRFQPSSADKMIIRQIATSVLQSMDLSNPFELTSTNQATKILFHYYFPDYGDFIKEHRPE